MAVLLANSDSYSLIMSLKINELISVQENLYNIKMKYIPRRISVTNQNGEEIEYTDADFFCINAPVIILGEPGAGKSELLRFSSEQLGAQTYNASTIEAEPAFDEQTTVIIVDGIDEITAYETGTPVNKILAKLPKTALFVLSCRAADWQDTVNTRIINQKWQQQPIVGRIMPLNQQEIIDFVNANGEGQNGEEFLKEAQQRDIVDLLRNPQNLLLLLKAVKSKGWPDTRLELYENASIELVKEDNSTHGSINKTRPASEQLIEAAGFIFAQLLLSGKTSINLDGHGGEEYPKVSELVSEDIDNEIIQSALSTKLFRLTGQNLLEPCHRTVAEFLAAKWIAKALGNQLSLSRLESILYGSNYIVPAALRGLHAWITTLNSSLASKFIERDPYGFFRYGDPSVLTIPQSKNLLNSLEKVAEIDPYFRSEDWHATFGRGLARKELRDDIIRVIRNPKSPYQLSHLIIESIQGDTFADDISSELLALVNDSSVTPLERHTAVDALAECNNQPDWQNMVGNLRVLGDIESLRIVIKIVQDRVELFNGTTISEILVELANAIAEGDGPNYAGLGYRLHKKLSVPQLEESLDVLSEPTTDESPKRRRSLRGDLDGWLFNFIQERFERGSLPPANKVWSWLKHAERHCHHRSAWDKYSREYFSQNIEYRQALQAEAINSVDNAEDLWMQLWHLGDASPGLWLREDDLILHLGNLLEEKDSYPDWDQRWKSLVRWGQINSDYIGEFIDLARNQASQNNILSSHLAELEKPPERDYEKEEKEREHKYRKEQQRKMRAVHQSYEKIQNELGAGKHLGALGDVAKAYLGHFTDLKEASSPTDRVVELVGSKMAPIAFQGLSAVMAGDDIPTARQIVELHANEQKEYFFESILLAHCAIMLQSSQHLSSLPLEVARSALAACQWDLNFGDDYTSDLQKQLEDIVFADKAIKEGFVRDTMEPYLNSGAEHVSGLYRLARNEEFSDITGSLAIEWIEKYSNLSNNSLRELLIAVIRYASRDRAIELICEYVSKEKWNNAEQGNIWISAAFLLDFDNSLELLTSYAEEKKDHLWLLREMSNPEREIYEGWPKLSSEQRHFLITKFGSLWPPADPPSGGWSGDQNPWDASQFIQGQIADLAADLSDQAEVLLRGLINADALDGYQNHIKHVYAQQTRRRAEANKVLMPISGVRNILLRGEPTTHDDLQALLIDELEALQEHIRNGTTNDVLPYWDGDTPHNENYCRDRITSAINPYLERYNVRAHTEGTMPNSKRCDLLNTHGLMNLPIEIKGQWHGEVWSAAAEQLHNYTREYHSDGRGIYLVLWFGYLGPKHPKNPHGWTGQPLPKAFNEMKDLLEIKFENVSEKTKIITLDLSKAS